MNANFKEIYEKYHNDLFRFLFYLVKNREVAEDLIQEVYIRVLRSYDKFEGKSSLKTWLFSIARNVSIDYFRKQQSLKNKLLNQIDWNRLEINDHHPLPEEIAIQNEEIRTLYKCLDACTLDQRTVIIVRFIQDMSIAETAKVLGWSESKVKTTQHRALNILRKNMEKLKKKEESTRE